jgi:hypothetical protein
MQLTQSSPGLAGKRKKTFQTKSRVYIQGALINFDINDFIDRSIYVIRSIMHHQF